MGQSTLYLSFGTHGGIWRGRPNNQPNSGPLVKETCPVDDTLHQAAGNNNTTSGGSFIVMASGNLGHIVRSVRYGANNGDWTLSKTQANPLYAMIYGSGHWVAAGDNDTILTSSDNGANWTTKNSKWPGSQWRWGAYGNGRFVLVGLNGRITYSTDNGSTWSKASSGSTEDFTGVAYSPTFDSFAACGSNHTIVIV